MLKWIFWYFVAAALLFKIADKSICFADPRIFPFQVGERLDFKVYLGIVLGGDAHMSVTEIEKIDGQPCYKIVSEARSTPTVDMFYKVRDRIVSWRDIYGNFSRRYDKRLREGNWKEDKRVDYQPEKGLALLYKRTDDQEPDSMQLDGLVQDVLSAFYYVRTKELEVGKSIWVDVHDINKRYDLEVQVLRKETIEVPAGEFNCFVVEPLLMSSGLFRREGDMQIWLSDDEHKLPIMMRSKLYFGSVWAKLSGFRLGGEE